jgi:spore germination cell wall hydrolase CwlJ-like protein
MYAVGQTVINRINSDRPEFKNKKTVADVALSRLKKGGYEYTGMDVTRNKSIQEEFKSTPENIRNGYARAYVIAEDLLSGEMEASPIVDPDIMWYTRKDAQNKWMQENLDLVGTHGLHDFYKAPK